MTLSDYIALDANSPTGLVWTKRPHARSAVRPGDAAFTARDPAGYFRGQFDNKNYLAHRVVFYLAHGYMPKMVDHRDGNGFNNAPGNLFAADAEINQHNRIARGWYRSGDAFVAQIRVGGKLRNIGRYSSAEQAHEAYLDAKRNLHPTAPKRCYGGSYAAA